MRSAHSLLLLARLIAPIALGGCNSGIALLASSSDSGGSNSVTTTVSNVTVSDAKNSPAEIGFTLTGQAIDEVHIEYLSPGATEPVPIATLGAEELWHALVQAGAKPCGLGARDTLRLEMGYPLWGQDLDPETSPLEAGLSWVVAWDHEFVGREALDGQKDSQAKQLVAFSTEGRAIPRQGYAVTFGSSTGEVTSGNFSPTLHHGIGLAHVSPPPLDDADGTVSIRGREVPAARCSLPFIAQ